MDGLSVRLSYRKISGVTEEEMFAMPTKRGDGAR